MRPFSRSVLLLLVAVCLAPALQNARAAETTTVKGWISDGGCASGRANGGVFTGTNPECARKCISSGAKIVLIVPDQKKLLVVANPEAARANIGDFVEVTGSVDANTKTLHIDTLKLLTKGVAMCDPPKAKP